MSRYYVEIVYRHARTKKLTLGVHEIAADNHKDAYDKIKAEHYPFDIVDNAHISSRYSNGRYLCNEWDNLPNGGR